ncbi:carboxypeptidase-like regulatory domain-containing protein [Seonamhaeicola maritimus]|uniref:Carboxypeptidase-like regulatory domain-containing protein n=1 Tax=Seonamhaeicola maritimus TaxID=2591822 RepID=A0A5C7GIF1_9FLAO|nr:carboxypeptidase-like regulatory domain-containing protein [Seonamhaeicola maritimus]TXG36885.1 carboxypeptidase-like regulatory domain-containing protein [Seonamhaeicola maritimus]
MYQLHLKITLFFLVGFQALIFSQEKIELEGLVKDEHGYEVPYAAVGIPSKYVGTATTEDGNFYLLLSNSNLEDVLEVSSIGYLTFKIKVQDLLNLKEKVIVLKEDIVSLDEVNLLASTDYVKNAFKNLKNSAMSTTHQLNMLYRRFSTEAGMARFFVEHYIKVLDRGPISPEYNRIEVVEGRKSADYRFIKDKYSGHQAIVTANRNPLRQGINQKSFKWTKVGDSSYDGEDLVILEGVGIKNKWKKIKLYIGVESYGVYKIETSDLNAVWIYRKASNGKLVLSYHNRVWEKDLPINDMQRRLLQIDKNKVKVSYRHELYILGTETNKKKIKVGNYEGYKKDMGDIEIKYNPYFWKNFSMPPETAFYKKSVKELESIYGVPLEQQFNAVNK